MAVRSINLKMVLSRKHDGERLRKSLWRTHATVNEAVTEIERILLLCRGRGYYTGDDELVAEETVRTEAIEFARAVQSENGKNGVGSEEEVLSALRQFYESLVPSVLLNEKGEPLEGNAQTSGGFASPMMDARSEGFQSIFDKILDPPPAWIGGMKENAPTWQKDSLKWLQSPEAQKLQKASGSPPGWVRRFRTGQPWQDAFVDDQEKKRKNVVGVPSLVRRMKQELGLLPMMRPPVSSRFVEHETGLTPWDRLALRLAVAHLLSWESWNHRAMSERSKVEEMVDRQRGDVESFGELVNALRGYEAERHKELERIALADEQRPYRIGVRATRGWDRVREAWAGSAGRTKQSRFDSLGELQAKLGGRFGDPELFRWLSEDGREELWRDRNPLPALARLNALEWLLSRKKAHALFTSADARIHPRWFGYEAPGGDNLRKYHLEIGQAGLTLHLPLLADSDAGLVEQSFEIPLASSGQLACPSWTGTGKARKLAFSSAHQTFSAKLRGAEILFARRHLENRKPEQLSCGDVGAVWFKLVLDVDPQAPLGWLDSRGQVLTPAAVHHFNTGLANKSKHIDKIEPGLRVLSVDLGVRTFASCAVFELIEGKPDKGLAFLADEGKNLWAKHERSFLLTLPGEIADSKTLAARSTTYDELFSLRRDLLRLKKLLRVSVVDEPEEREAQLDELRMSIGEELARGGTTALDLSIVKSLEAAVSRDQEAWEGLVRKTHRNAERVLGDCISRWRSRTRPRVRDKADRMVRRRYFGGKSAWAIEYLTTVRRLLQSWSLHGRRYGQINRADREKRGTFAASLLEHVNAIKEDRIKAGSDLIVQAARGYVPDRKGGWVQAFEPCRVILFEDLARYRFRTDRPRRENSRLMQWSHRSVVRETQMQAQLYGIVVESTGAGFTSRFHARTGAPGCRTRLLTSENLQSAAIQKQLGFLGERLKLDAKCFRPGDRVPWDGGSEFATIGDDKNPVVIHADVNAAQNLQRRFWTRHGDAYRISAVEVSQDGQSVWYSDRDGVRLRGALARLVGGNGYARLVPTDDSPGFRLERVSSRAWQRAVGGRAVADGETGLDELEAEAAAVTETEDVERLGGRRVFFRDPSGLFLPADRWYEAKIFWSQVQRSVARALGLLPADP